MWERRPEVLLLPNIPQPLHGINPRTVLGSKWWDVERRTAYASTNYHCEACGISKFDIQGRKILEGHEVYDTNYELGRLVYVRTTPLCPPCHKFIHDGRLTSLLETRQISTQHFASIMKHGHRVLSLAGLSRPSLQERDRMIEELARKGKLAIWKDWRLVVNNVEYPPQFENAEEANEHYRSRHGDNRLGPVSWIETLSSDRMRRRAKSVLVGVERKSTDQKTKSIQAGSTGNKRNNPFSRQVGLSKS